MALSPKLLINKYKILAKPFVTTQHVLAQRGSKNIFRKTAVIRTEIKAERETSWGKELELQGSKA